MCKRVVIGGSRYFNNYALFSSVVGRYLSELRKEHKIIILSGHCEGTDAMAERYAKEQGFGLEIYPADWEQFGKSAGPIRNRQMVNVADYAIAFTTGGKGTESLIEFAKKKGIPIKMCIIK